MLGYTFLSKNTKRTLSPLSPPNNHQTKPNPRQNMTHVAKLSSAHGHQDMAWIFNTVITFAASLSENKNPRGQENVQEPCLFPIYIQRVTALACWRFRVGGRQPSLEPSGVYVDRCHAHLPLNHSFPHTQRAPQ